MALHINKFYLGEKIGKEEMGRTCGMYVGVVEYVHGVGTEICRKGNIWKIWIINFYEN